MVFQEIKDDDEQDKCKGAQSTPTAGKPREERSMDSYKNQKLLWIVVKIDDTNTGFIPLF